ncbi:MAG TPA: hypothetical protein VMC42_06860 [Methanoregulaceae archaeon]|nr:hypothetical protein [Methanoregulaceae archaeon]
MVPDDIRLVRPDDYTGEGRSRGLARGLLAYYGELNLTAEGMGIGGVALKDRYGTCFSRSWKDSEECGLFKRTFCLDTRLVWGIGGRPVPLLSWPIQLYTDAYMKMPWLQNRILAPALKLRTMAGIMPLFITIPSRGTVTLTYEISGGHAQIHASSTVQAGPGERLCILNELSAAHFTSGWDGEHLVPPPPGWDEVSHAQLPVSLADPSHGVRFFIDKPQADPGSPYRIYQGRENTGDLCWAGFCIELGPLNSSGTFPELKYQVGLALEPFP